MKKSMKMIIALIFVMTAVLCFFSVAALAEAPEAETGVADAMQSTATAVMIDYAVRIVCAFLLMLIGVLGTWLTGLAGKNKKMQNVAAAIAELTEATQITVGSLQQTVVDGLKAAHTDHKLTKYEIQMLGVQLKEKTMKKLSQPALKVLEAASVDVEAWIEDAGEDWINALKKESGVPIEEAIEVIE